MTSKFTYNTRDYHEANGIKSKYTDWFYRLANRLGLKEHTDYICVAEGCKKSFYVKGVETLTAPAARKISKAKASQKAAETFISLIETPEGFVRDGNELFITSTFLAELSGKRHSHIKRDLNTAVNQLKSKLPGDESKLCGSMRFAVEHSKRIIEGVSVSSYKDEYGRGQEMYILNEVAALYFAVKISPMVGSYVTGSFIEYRNAALRDAKEWKAKDGYGFVYVMENPVTGQHKIGISNDPDRRRRTFQTGAGTPIYIQYTSPVTFDSRHIESLAHKQFEPYREHGEWFNEALKIGDIIDFLEANTKGV